MDSRCGYIRIERALLKYRNVIGCALKLASEDAVVENFNNGWDTPYTFLSIANNLSTCSASLVLVTTNSIPYR